MDCFIFCDAHAIKTNNNEIHFPNDSPSPIAQNAQHSSLRTVRGVSGYEQKRDCHKIFMAAPAFSMDTSSCQRLVNSRHWHAAYIVS